MLLNLAASWHYSPLGALTGCQAVMPCGLGATAAHSELVYTGFKSTGLLTQDL
jgi:hypothetical protein